MQRRGRAIGGWLAVAAAAAVGLVQRAGEASDGESSQPAPRDGSPVESAAERDDVETGANAFVLGDDDELILVAPVRAKGSASRTASAFDASGAAAGDKCMFSLQIHISLPVLRIAYIPVGMFQGAPFRHFITYSQLRICTLLLWE